MRQPMRTRLPGMPKLSDEVAQYFEARQKRLSIVKTTRTPSGQIIDWVPLESQHPEIAKPPPLQDIRPKAFDPKYLPVAFELENAAVDRGPPGTVPILRPRLHPTEKFEPIKREIDVRLFTPREDWPLTGKFDFPSPDPVGYYHATSSESIKCFGCETILNVYAPYCELSGDHSLSQFGLQNYDNPLRQSIEVGWSVSRDQFQDDLPHLFTFYTTNGYKFRGDGVGGYNSDFSGWVQFSPIVYPGAKIVGLTPGDPITNISSPLMPMAEMLLRCIFMGGNWWIFVGGIPIGYYPGNLFLGKTGKPDAPGTTLADHADWCGFWGEVYSARANPSQTITSMGSGQHGKLGFPWACYQRNTRVLTDAAGSMQDSNGKPSAEDPNMYDILSTMKSGPDWGSYFYFGGSGIGTPHITVQSIWP